MEPISAVIYTRALERILVVIAGIVAIYVGYRLFALVPDQKDSEGKFKLPGGVSVVLSRIGPGVFFALFGTGLIGYSASRPVTLEQFGLAVEDVDASQVADNAKEPALKYSGFDNPDESLVAGDLHVSRVASPGDVVGILNSWLAGLPSDTPPLALINRRIAVKEAKLAILRDVWDDGNWGDYGAFHAWVVSTDGKGTPPKGSEAAAALFVKMAP